MFDDFDLGPQCEEFYNDNDRAFWESLETPENIDDDDYWEGLTEATNFDVM